MKPPSTEGTGAPWARARRPVLGGCPRERSARHHQSWLHRDSNEASGQCDAVESGESSIGCRTNSRAAEPSHEVAIRVVRGFGLARRQQRLCSLDSLPTCNANGSSRMTLCTARASHFYRAKFIPQLCVNRRTIVSQIPAMMPVLF